MERLQEYTPGKKKPIKPERVYNALADVQAGLAGEPERFWSRVTGKGPGIETYHRYVKHPVGKLEVDFWGHMTQPERNEAAVYFKNGESEISREYKQRGRVDTLHGAFNPERCVRNVTTTTGTLRSKHMLEATAKFALRSFEATRRDQLYNLLLARLETGEFLYASGDATLRAESMAWFALAWIHDRDHAPGWAEDADRMGFVSPKVKEREYGDLLKMDGRKAFEKSLEDKGNISKIADAIDSLKDKYGVNLGAWEEAEHAKAKKALTGLRDDAPPKPSGPDGWPAGVEWPVIREGRTMRVSHTRTRFPAGVVTTNGVVVLAPLKPENAQEAYDWVTRVDEAVAAEAAKAYKKKAGAFDPDLVGSTGGIYWEERQIAREVTKWLASLKPKAR